MSTAGKALTLERSVLKAKPWPQRGQCWSPDLGEVNAGGQPWPQRGQCWRQSPDLEMSMLEANPDLGQVSARDKALTLEGSVLQAKPWGCQDLHLAATLKTVLPCSVSNISVRNWFVWKSPECWWIFSFARTACSAYTAQWECIHITTSSNFFKILKTLFTKFSI